MQRVFDEQDLIIAHGRARVRGTVGAKPEKGSRAQPHLPVGEPGRPPTNPAYKSTWESAYAQHLDILEAAGEIVGWWYEPIRFRLPGPRNFYKPDFLVQAACKQRYGSMAGQHAGIEIVEVKGWSKNRREGITKFKTAAGLNPWALFKLVKWDGRQWVEQRM